MESKKIEQKSFRGIITDINELNLDIAKGVVADNFNGTIAAIGNQKYAWVSDEGTTKIFSIPNIAGQHYEAEKGKARIYLFDDRIFASDIKNSLTQAVPAPGDYVYEFILEFVPYTNDFTGIDLSGPQMQIRVQSIITRTLTEILTTNMRYSYRLGGSGAWNTTTTYNTHNVDLNQILISMHSSLATYYNLIIPNVLTGLGLRNSTATSGYIAETNTAYTEITMFYDRNIVIKSIKGDSAESSLLLNENRYGFGLGSKNESIGYPNAPQYPIPGSDYKINPFADYWPEGITTDLKENTPYYVENGVVERSQSGTITAVGPGMRFTVNSNSETTPAQNNYHYFKSSNGKNPKIIECNPIGFGYGLTVQKATLDYYTKTVAQKYVGRVSVDKNTAILFFTGVGVTTTLYKLNTLGSPIIEQIFQTKEDIDIDEYSKIIGFCKFDDANNIRVYWTSGKGHLRSLNLNQIPTTDIDFHTRLIKPCDFGDIKISNVSRTGGACLVGSYQFCFELSIDGFVWTRASQHTTPISIGQSYWGAEGLVGGETKTATYPKANPEIEPSYRGAIPGTKTTESINVAITNIDPRYNYIRVFSLEYISGSGSVVVNKIYEQKLEKKEYYYLRVVHQGAPSVIEGNLNISEVTERMKVPMNVKWISQINNRMIVANFTEEYKLRSDLPANPNLLTKIAKQKIGCDTTEDIERGPNGYKNWENQYKFKTFQAEGQNIYAWVYIDEYGNESEPSEPFVLPFNFRRFINCQFDPLLNHPHGMANWKKNFVETSGGNGSQEAIFVNIESLYNSTFKVQGGYDLYSYGMYLKFQSQSWPIWAKKAILVQKKLETNKRYVITEGYGILTTEGIKVGYLPELEGYNTYDNYVFSNGDRVKILGASFVTHDVNGNWNDPTTYFFPQTPEYFTGTANQSFEFEIQGYNQIIYPKKDEAGIYGNEDKMPAETISSRGFEFQLNLGTKYSEIMATVSNPPGYSVANPIVKFQIVRPSNFDLISEDTEEYVATNFSVDLTKRYKNEYRRTFFGDSYISTNHMILAMRSRFFYFDTAYLGAGISSVFNEERAYTPVVVMPLITYFNMAMADDSAFPFYRMNAIIHNYNCQGFRNINKDYGVLNNKIPYKFISEEILPKRSTYNNVFLYSDVSVIGLIYDGYAILKAVNQIEVQSNFGQITSIFEKGGKLIVIQQNGARTFNIDTKEFVQTTAGSMIAVSAGGFVDPNHSNASITLGSDYPALETEAGVYFISADKSKFCVALPDKIVILSTDMGFQNLMSNYDLDRGINPAFDFNDVRLFFEASNRIIYLFIQARSRFTNVTGVTSLSVTLNKGLKKPEVGKYYFTKQTVGGNSWKLYFKVTEVIIFVNNYLVNFEESIPVPGICPENEMFEVDILDQFFAGFNEQESILEFRSSNARKTSLPNGIHVDTILENQLSVKEETSDKFFNMSELFPKINLGGDRFNNLWYNANGISVLNNTTPDNYETDIIISLGGVLPLKMVFLSSQKEQLFHKGITYTIEYEIDFFSGGNLPNGMKYLIGPMYDLIVDNCTMVTPATIDLAMYDNASTAIKSYTFKVNKSFISPIMLYAIQPSLSINSITHRIKLRKFNYYETVESHVETYVSDQSGNIISYDNLILSGEQTTLPDRIEIYSKEQNETLIVNNVSNYGKMRLRQMQFAVPKLITKERLRSTYFKAKFVYISQGVKKVINAVESFYRTL